MGGYRRGKPSQSCQHMTTRHQPGATWARRVVAYRAMVRRLSPVSCLWAARSRCEGVQAVRPSRRSRRCERFKLPGRSKIKMTANCFGTLPVSIARNAWSAELARSMIDRSSFGVSILCASRIVDAPCQLDGPTDQYWTVTLAYARRPNGPALIRGTKVLAKDDQWRLYAHDRTTSVGGRWMPARHMEVRDEKRDRHQTR
jgi:hypothetical protein